ncbi:MAG: peptidoglycan editing factor PgeF [Candidatus Moraniibacteriota bacterium]
MLDFFRQFPEVFAVLSERKDGPMKAFPERPEENRENRKRFFSEQGIASDGVVSAELVHGTEVAIVSDTSQTVILGTDALVTKEKKLFLSVTVADCLPVFFYDPMARVIGIAHAGWRGIVGGVIGKTVDAMIECGAKQIDICVAFGPNIQKCHFEIGTDILSQFAGYEQYILERNAGIFVDLQGIAKEQLKKSGISGKNIEKSLLCTFCEPEKFFSHRRDKMANIPAMAAVIGMI